uniref:Large ribosomal subunit protein uL13c n=1 Tax=Kuetzingia canaliculata TaxID=228262 RepID=A0A1Z1MQB7_KUECA|nr:ribosomal protein L13 [Kuetzingia canaliculata]ARW67934.1 ribosomal protein L13 [Kuetzingia canaliculata]
MNISHNNKNITIETNQVNQTNWYIIDAKNKTLGRLSTKIAYILKGKNNATYLPYNEGNSNIIVINSKHIKITGNKRKQKVYKRHSGKPGGLKIETFEKVQKKKPNKIIEHAVRGMLPKNSLGRKVFKKLKVYPNNQHPHKSQKPLFFNI